MSDTAGHVAPQPDPSERRHTLTVREVESLFAQAGVPRSHRHVLRLCQSGMLDAVKVPGPSGEEWYVSPASVPKAIGDLKQIDAQRARRSAPQPAAPGSDRPEIPTERATDTPGHGPPQPDASAAETRDRQRPPRPAAPGPGAADMDIYEHPYVRRLEAQIEKLETKYDAQVRRTEEIQLKGAQQLVDLQRMVAVGQSQTLADFMLKARNWLLGQGSEDEKTEPPRVDNSREGSAQSAL
jgi:hypothetical protein